MKNNCEYTEICRLFNSLSSFYDKNILCKLCKQHYNRMKGVNNGFLNHKII